MKVSKVGFVFALLGEEGQVCPPGPELGRDGRRGGSSHRFSRRTGWVCSTIAIAGVSRLKVRAPSSSSDVIANGNSNAQNKTFKGLAQIEKRNFKGS